MEKENKKGLKILLIIFIILTLCLSSYIIYDKVLIDNKEVENQNIVTEKNDDEEISLEKNNDDEISVEKNSDVWIDYILNSNIKEIKITNYDKKVRELNKNELEELFNLIRNQEVTKEYNGGFGGCTDYTSTLSVKYQRNNKTYIFYMGCKEGIEEENEETELYYITNIYADGEFLEIIENISTAVIDDYCKSTNAKSCSSKIYLYDKYSNEFHKTLENYLK